MFGFLSRRRFLRLGLGALAGTTAAVGGGVGGLWLLRGRAEAPDGLRVLSAHEYRTMVHVARAIVPRAGAFAEGADDFDIARLFDGWLADEPPERVRELSMALTLVEYGPVFYERRLATFSNLEPDEQRAHWERWAVADSLVRRQVSLGLRRFVTLVVYDQPEVWPHLGYEGPA